MSIVSIIKTYISLWVTIGIALFFPLKATAELPTDTVISDMALIYQGGTQRPDWTASQLVPYVTHKFADGHTDWFFDSFLFLEFTDNWQVAFGYKYGSRNATKTDWEWLLNRIFEKDKSLSALNACIEHYKKVLGAPSFRHKIVLGIASPITGQTDWGALDGDSLDFNVQADQVKAAKWYIDELVSRFKAAGLDNLDLVGFYWLEETTAKCGDLPKYVGDYVHSIGKRFYWIPYWKAPGFEQWKELNFDVAFIQPNHFFHKDVLDNRLDDACRLAKQMNMSLEMEFDGKVLYENTDSYYTRLETYINAFEKYGVFDRAPIAYYSGTRAILDMYYSSAIENTLILDRIASHIVQRHNVAAGIVAPVASVPDVIVAGGNGEIYITGEARNIRVYNLSGRLISLAEKLVRCAPGIYIVDADGVRKKVIVR